MAGGLTAEKWAAHRDALSAGRDLLGTSSTVSDATTASHRCGRAKDQLTALEALAIRTARALNLSTPLTPNIAIRLVEMAHAVGGLGEGALALRFPRLATPNAVERIVALKMRAEILLNERDTLDALFAPEMRPSVAEIRQMVADLTEAPSLLPSLLSGAYRRAVRKYRGMTAGRKVERATMSREAALLLRHAAALETFLADRTLPELFGVAASGLESPFAAALALLGWIGEATASVRALGESGRALASAVWSTPAECWMEAAAVVAADVAGVEAAALFRGTLFDVTRSIRTNEPTSVDGPIPELGERLRLSTSIAASAAGVGLDAEAEESTSLSDLLGRLVLVERAWTAEETLASCAPTFREIETALPPPRRLADDADPLSNVRHALEYLSQFKDSSLSAPLMDWLATGDSSTRVSYLQAAAFALAASIGVAVGAERSSRRPDRSISSYGTAGARNK